MASGSEFHTGGGAFADIDCSLGVIRMIREIWWPASGYGSPTEVRPTGQVLDLGGAIPWGRCLAAQLEEHELRYIHQDGKYNSGGKTVSVLHVRSDSTVPNSFSFLRAQ